MGNHQGMEISDLLLVWWLGKQKFPTWWGKMVDESHGRMECGKKITKTKQLQDYQRDRLVNRDLGTL